jgi:peptidoglycan/LPS O-acetylase OafA/YrhL
MVIPAHAREILGGDDFFGSLLNQLLKFGWAGVDLFFVLSGFLIGSQLLSSLKSEGRVNFLRFYLKRSFRILPSFYFVLLIYYLWPTFRETPDLDPPWRFLLFVMNYGRNGDAFSHAWSLCVEEHFYLVFPMLVAVCAWKPKLFRPVIVIGTVMIGVVLLRYYLWLQDASFYPAVYRKSHTHLDGLTVGVSLALIRAYRETLWSKLTSSPSMMLALGIVLVCVSMWLNTNVKALSSYVFTFTLVSLGYGAIVTAAVSPNFWLYDMKIPGAAI